MIGDIIEVQEKQIEVEKVNLIQILNNKERLALVDILYSIIWRLEEK